MKELSIEEKAKRYDKALERAKGAHNSAKSDKENGVTDKITEYTIQLAETIFPELKVSDDERIRKSLIELFHDTVSNDEIFSDYGLDKTEVLAWLEKQYKKDSQVTLPSFTFDDILALQCCMETVKKVQEDKDLYEKLKDLHGRVYDAYQLEKQGEQKPVEWCSEDEQNLNACLGHIPDEFLRRWLKDVIHTKYDKSVDKVEPKFHEGDWVVSKLDRRTRQISEVHCDEYNKYYIVEGNDYNLEEYDRLHHLWTIQDAKDGDVLVSAGNQPFIYNGKYTDSTIGAHIGISYDGKELFIEEVYNWTANKDVKPATKEQQDLLFQRMKKDGYEWNEDKKELIKL